MRPTSLYLIAFLSLPVMGWGDSGTTSADFLKLGIGPRAIAMGNAQVGLADDVYSTFWNPAGLSQLGVAQVGFVQTQYVQDVNEQYIAYAQPTHSLGTFGASLTYLSVGKFEGFDATGLPTGAEVGSNDAAFGLSYAYPIYQERRYGTLLFAGVTGKWIQERLDTVSTKAFAGDAGLLFAPGKKWGNLLEGWRAGLSLRNVGTSVKFDQEAYSLPRSLTAGLSYTNEWRGESFTAAFDGQQPNDGPRSFNAGVEVLTLKTFLLRGGYTSNDDLGNGLRVGAGIRFKDLQIDYAFAGAGSFGNAHRLGVTFSFGAKPTNIFVLAEDWYERGVKDYRHGRYTEALVDFNKSLEVNPDHPQALEMMNKTYEKIQQTIPE